MRRISPWPYERCRGLENMVKNCKNPWFSVFFFWFVDGCGKTRVFCGIFPLLSAGNYLMPPVPHKNLTHERPPKWDPKMNIYIYIYILRRNDPSPEGTNGLFSSSNGAKVPANGQWHVDPSWISGMLRHSSQIFKFTSHIRFPSGYSAHWRQVQEK